MVLEAGIAARMVLAKASTSLPVLSATSALCVRVMMPKVGRESKARQIEPVRVL